MNEKTKDEKYKEYEKIKKEQSIFEALRPLIYFLEYQGLRRNVDYKITILDNGVVDLFVGDVKAEYGKDEYVN